jgi:hypothetical protein
MFIVVGVSREEVEALFKDHDKDLDDKLSWAEFLGEKTKSETVFTIMDQNYDGRISKRVSARARLTIDLL